MEKWSPCNWLSEYDFYLDSVSHAIECDKDVLELTFSSVVTESKYRICFKDVFSYRVTKEHFFLCQYSEEEFARVCPQPHEFAYIIQDSSYVEALSRSGMYNLHSELPVNHYIIQTDLHVIDVILHASSEIIIENVLTGELRQING